VSGASWQPQPTQVTFEPGKEQKVTFSVRGQALDVVHDEEEEEGAEDDVQG